MRQLDSPGYRHEALFYRGDEEFLAGTVPLVRDAVCADAAVLVALPISRARVLRMALGPEARRVGFADMETLGRNPGRIIGAWRDFVREHAGGHAAPVGLGEPIWPGRSPAEVVECQRHETLLNLAFPPATPTGLAAIPSNNGAAPTIDTQSTTAGGVLDSDMLSKIATIGIMVLVDTPMRAEAIEHLDNLGSLPFGQQIDLQIEVISMICYNAHSVLLYQHEGRQQDRFQ